MIDGRNPSPNFHLWRAKILLKLVLRLGAISFAASSVIVAPATATELGAASPALDNLLNDLFERESLTSDWFGYRKILEDDGVVFGSDEIVDLLADPVGGQKQGASAEGRFELFANVDLGSAIGWKGATVHANGYWIHGAGLSTTNVNNLLTVSNIEARPATRLFALWIQQSFFDDRVSVRAGQIAADDEFFISQTATLFVNSTFGWPSILGINLPSGGPAYPLSTPGIRIRVAVSPALTVTAAAFNGDPAPPGPGEAQHRDATGTSFRTDRGLFLIGETAYSYSVNSQADNLPGTVKLGAWYHDAEFADQRYDNSGLSLANPSTTGIPARHDGNFGGYVIVDQLLWRKSGSGDQGPSAFVRVGANPADRNLIEFHIDMGLNYTGLLPGRDNDVMGIGVSYDRISDARRDLAKDLRSFTNPDVPVPDFEAAIELSYQTQVAPWLIVQPDAQFIVHPGAHLVSLETPSSTRTSPNAFVFGMRMAISL